MKTFSLFRTILVLTTLLLPSGAAGQSFPQYWVMDKNVGILFEGDTVIPFVSSSYVYPQADSIGWVNFVENFSCLTMDSGEYYFAGQEQIFSQTGSLLVNGANVLIEPEPSYSETNGTILVGGFLNDPDIFYYDYREDYP